MVAGLLKPQLMSIFRYTNGPYHGGITWSYEELNSLVFYLCNVYNYKEFNSSYDIQQQRVHFSYNMFI